MKVLIALKRLLRYSMSELSELELVLDGISKWSSFSYTVFDHVLELLVNVCLG